MSDPQLPARFANRQTRRAVATGVATGLGSASPPFISIKGGAFTLVDANGEQSPVESKYLDCVIFDVNAEVTVQRVYWGKDRPFDPGSDAYQPPLCFSDNGIGASRNAQEPQSPSCQMCPQHVWGSAVSKISGKGVKACGAIKKVAVLAMVGKETAYDFPFLLRVPIMSHENLRVYSDKFKGKDFDVSDVVTRVSFVHGAVGVLDFEAVDFTGDDVEALVQKAIESHVTDAMIGRGDMPVQGSVPADADAGRTSHGITQHEYDARRLKEEPRPLSSAPTAVDVLAPPSGKSVATGPLGDGTASVASPAKSKRPRKQSESSMVLPTENSGLPRGSLDTQANRAPFAQAPKDDSIPPFLRRDAQAPGIQQNAPAPTPEIEAALKSVFDLKVP
jgi:hypothetical protein